MSQESQPKATRVDPSGSGWQPAPHSREDPSSANWTRSGPGRPSPDSSQWATAERPALASATAAHKSTQDGRASSKTPVAIAAALVLCLAIPYVLGTSSLKKDLMGKRWENVKSYAILEMNFTNSRIGFKAWNVLWEQHLGSFDYAVISPWGFIANTAGGWKYYKADVDDTMLTVSPAIEGSDSRQVWFGID